MPRGALPGERRGGRAKGTPNKYTQGKMMMHRRRARTLDGALQHLTQVIAELVPDAADRDRLGRAIDVYIERREDQEAKRQRHSRSVVTGVPPEPWQQLQTVQWQQLQVTEGLPLKVDPEIAALDLNGIMAVMGIDPKKVAAEAARQIAAEEAE